MDKILEEQTLRPPEGKGVWGDAGGWSQNCAVSWCLPRAGGDHPIVCVLWGKMQLFHVTVYSLSCGRYALEANFYLLKVCPHVVVRAKCLFTYWKKMKQVVLIRNVAELIKHWQTRENILPHWWILSKPLTLLLVFQRQLHQIFLRS